MRLFNHSTVQNQARAPIDSGEVQGRVVNADRNDFSVAIQREGITWERLESACGWGLNDTAGQCFVIVARTCGHWSWLPNGIIPILSCDFLNRRRVTFRPT